MAQFGFDDVVQAASLIGTIAGFVGGGSALFVDVMRRQIRAKAAEYAAQNDFNRISNAVEVLQRTLENQVKATAQNHTTLLERVAHLEGRFNAFQDR